MHTDDHTVCLCVCDASRQVGKKLSVGDLVPGHVSANVVVAYHGWAAQMLPLGAAGEMATLVAECDRLKKKNKARTAHFVVTSTSLSLLDPKDGEAVFQAGVASVAKHIAHPSNARLLILVTRNRPLGFARCHLLSFPDAKVCRWSMARGRGLIYR